VRRQVSSRLLALVVAGANFVVCCGVVTAQYALRPDDPLPTAVVVLDMPETFVPPRTEYQQVLGPGGMTTHIPADWPTKVSTGPGVMQADDPTGSLRFLRYGGFATPVTDSYQVHFDYERGFARDKAGYVSLRLERTTVRGMPAIDWEFEYDAREGRRHARSVYWLAQGHEYFVYASAPVPLWLETQEILDVMLDNSTP
jgi:hypothetical protein